jgi:hypothetical protein
MKWMKLKYIYIYYYNNKIKFIIKITFIQKKLMDKLKERKFDKIKLVFVNACHSEPVGIIF